MAFHTTVAYSNLGLTNVPYSIRRLCREDDDDNNNNNNNNKLDLQKIGWVWSDSQVSVSSNEPLDSIQSGELLQ
jgi:hypothetical protein